jgi:ABC-2 type transport system ATP-binding protein
VRRRNATNRKASTGMISVTGFSKNYGDTLAVQDLSFAVAGGSILGMLGPNGAGKTTTLRAISGILRPTTGRLLIGGHDIVQSPVEAKQQLALVPDDPRLFDSLTVWEHLDFMAAAYRVGDFAPAAESLLSQFELTDQRHTAARELSRGMRQKVAICCAYLHRPAAILFDEPMTGLDPRGIRTLKTSIREQAAAGAAVVISSHLLSLVEDLCTDLLIMHHGQRLFFGSMAEARSQYPDLQGETSLEDIFFKATES